MRPGGIVTLKALQSGCRELGGIVTMTERKIRGSFYGSISHRGISTSGTMAGKLRLEELVTQRYRLDEINEAYASMLTGGVARGVIVF